ncbi:MAG TPA: aminotransferase class III-fold pyridoxal phosphate-dependent enzyme [Steroidobacteraceae bacterium]|jgi:acetylornithine/N-succinyldiaminopimelate aminotransferase|nr:aminotransferase class III-fold pyridoxal phosphate-dependent enzyme [Steroidobacteraceae bacterium]
MNSWTPPTDHLAPVYAQWALDVVGASGVHLHTRDGRKVLDLYGGHAVAALGYSHPRLLAALEQQARSLIFQSNAVPLEVRARAATRLTRFAGLGLNTAFFVSTGAEANENALKLALKTTGRRRVVAVEGSFHGRTAAAGAVTWGALDKWYGFPQAPFDVEFVPRGDVAAVRRIVGEDTAAVIVEPVQGVGGALDLGAEFLGALRTRCTESDALLIFDEVQCGMGRTGFPFAANLYGIAPDMITTAKALGGGFPCAALLLTDHVARHLRTDDLGTTFGGGPMACAMIETVVDVIESEGLLANVRSLSQRIRETCVVGPVVATQGAGFLLGLRTRRPAKDVQRELLERHDILTGTSGDPHVVRILAPFVLEPQHVETLCEALSSLPA